MKIIEAFRSHVFQTAENKELMLVSNHLGAFLKMESQGSVTVNCQNNIPHHQRTLKFSSWAVRIR